MNKRILVANDDLFFGGRILSVLEKSGFETATAATADEAERLAGSSELSLAIVNLNSRRLGGIELIRRLRAAHSDLKILAFLSHTLIPPVKDEVFSAGANKLATNGAVSTRLPSLVDRLLHTESAGEVEED
jgi:DNA-binding response OmpR family regulator